LTPFDPAAVFLLTQARVRLAVAKQTRG